MNLTQDHSRGGGVHWGPGSRNQKTHTEKIQKKFFENFYEYESILFN